jgi:hypothetical protein
MNFITRWLNKKFNRYLKDAEVGDYATTTIAGSPKTSNLNSFGMNFTVYKANGGFIIEYHYYDRHRDRSENKLHIVTEDKDLGEELGKIISFETLRS